MFNCSSKLYEGVCRTSPINTTNGPFFRNEPSADADWVVFSVYFGVIVCIALLSAFRNRGSLSGFFLTARSANWFLIGMSMFSSNIGSGHFIGLAGSAAAYGISVALYELNAIVVLPLLGWFFAPVYMAANVSTMPEYLRARFGGRRVQIYIACVALFLYIFTKISADLYAGTLYLNNVLGLNRFLAIILLLVVAAFFTIIGGMTAVLWTNAVQLVVVAIGAFYLLFGVLSYPEIGGVEHLFQRYIESRQNITLSDFTEHSPDERKAVDKCITRELERDRVFHLFQPATEHENAPWPGATIGITVLSIWYWCSDQVITQHVLASKNLSHAKLGSLLTAFFKLFSAFMFVLPGMAARVLYPDYIACADPVLCCCFCDTATGCTNYAYTVLAADKRMPGGIRGLMAITISAALISSFASIFNACSAIFTMDIWRLIRPKASSKELQIVGRVFIVIVCTVSMLWMVIISGQQYLFDYIQQMTAYFSPPLAAVFLLAIFWKRCNEQGVFYGLMVGLLVGVVRFLLEFSYSTPSCAENVYTQHDIRPPALRNVHYLHFAIILFGITTLVTVCLSMVTKPPDKSRIDGLTYWTRYEPRIVRRPKMKRQFSSNLTPKNGCTTPGENDKDNDDNIDLTATFAIEQDQQSEGNQADNSPRNVSKWRHFVSWLCGIETDVNDANDLDIYRRSTGASAGQHHHGPTTSGQDIHVVPTSSALFEEPWLRTVSSVILVILITVFLFMAVLLF